MYAEGRLGRKTKRKWNICPFQSLTPIISSPKGPQLAHNRLVLRDRLHNHLPRIQRKAPVGL